MADHFKCVGVDLEGQGDTPAPADSTKNMLEQMAEDLLAVVDHFGRDGLSHL